MKTFSTNLTLALGLLLFSLYIFGAELSNPRFKLLSTQNGLSQKTVQAIYQDSIGFLWFGTQEGLNLYDGRGITVFRNNLTDKTSISNDVIRSICEDLHGNIWVGTSGGLNKFIRQNKKFERIKFDQNDHINSQRVNVVYLDSKGALWIGTDGYGVYKGIANENDNETVLKNKSFNFQRIDALKQFETDDIRAIYEDSRNRIWVGTDGNGVAVIDQASSSFTLFKNDEENTSSLSHNNVRTIVEDHRGKIWIGTRGGGANKFDELNKTFERYIPKVDDSKSIASNRVYQIFEDDDQRLWFATDGGISVYNEVQDSFTNIQNIPSMHSSLSHNRVLSILQDKSGLMWYGTLSGVNQWNPLTAEFVNYRYNPEQTNGLSFNHVHGLSEGLDENIYIATFGGGLNIYDKNTDQFKNVPDSVISDKHLITLTHDKKGNLWVGTLSKGVEVFDQSFNKIASYSKNTSVPASLSDNGVTGILEASDGEIWVSTYRAGLNRLDNDSKTFKHYRLSENGDGLVSENIYTVIEDDEGYIWVATEGGGISRLDKHNDSIRTFINNPKDLKSLSGNSVLSLYQDSKGRFWIGTQGNGLNRWEPSDRRKGHSNFIHYNTENGLNSSTINGVIEDDDGFIWISTVKGVSRLNPDTNKIIHFNLADEIHENELNPGATLKAQDGRLYFGGLDGVSAFYPNKIKQNGYVPPVVLTRVMSENKSLYFDDPINEIVDINFDHNDNLIAFEFAALEYSMPHKNRYQYKLEGFDDDWIQNGTFNRAIYTNLPSGSYVLKVKGSNNDVIWSDESVNLGVNISPAPWVSWWAYTFYGIAFCIALISMIRSQARRLANEEVFKEQVSKKVAEKNSLYTKNTDFLKAQLEQFKHRSNVDLDTGLPNQKYLCDLVAATMHCISRFQQEGVEPPVRLCVSIIRLPELIHNNADTIYLQTIKNFSRLFGTQNDFHIVVRWNKRDIGLLTYFEDPVECHRKMQQYQKELSQAFEIASEQSDNLQLNSSYALVPFTGVNQSFIDGEKLMMLIEHILHLVECESEIDIVGCVKLNQILNTTNFRQILAAERLVDLSEVFGLATE